MLETQDPKSVRITRQETRRSAAIDGLAKKWQQTCLFGQLRDQDNTTCNFNHAKTWDETTDVVIITFDLKHSKFYITT